MSEFPYYYPWKNNPRRSELYGRRFRVLARNGRFDWNAPAPNILTLIPPKNGRLPTGTNSALVEFENGETAVISRNAIRKVK